MSNASMQDGNCNMQNGMCDSALLLWNVVRLFQQHKAQTAFFYWEIGELTCMMFFVTVLSHSNSRLESAAWTSRIHMIFLTPAIDPQHHTRRRTSPRSQVNSRAKPTPRWSFAGASLNWRKTPTITSIVVHRSVPGGPQLEKGLRNFRTMLIVLELGWIFFRQSKELCLFCCNLF